ncbi:hypothetical protein VR44_25035 [Streptomyces katrae]|uniref:Uncharacterized protein n=1 Tax=Streptomyces katrae TaxID=68223 RepID=A0A0F4J4D7_9ACTN|nr:hypothetical protein VR44_25035 [Streptomyces katrae]
MTTLTGGGVPAPRLVPVLYGPERGLPFSEAYQQAGGILAAAADERLYWQVREPAPDPAPDTRSRPPLAVALAASSLSATSDGRQARWTAARSRGRSPASGWARRLRLDGRGRR